MRPGPHGHAHRAGHGILQYGLRLLITGHGVIVASSCRAVHCRCTLKPRKSYFHKPFAAAALGLGPGGHNAQYGFTYGFRFSASGEGRHSTTNQPFRISSSRDPHLSQQLAPLSQTHHTSGSEPLAPSCPCPLRLSIKRRTVTYSSARLWSHQPRSSSRRCCSVCVSSGA
jgi:hypothetical protein